MRLITTILLLFLTIPVFAAENCTPVSVKVQNKNILLEGPSEKGLAKIYFIQNTTNLSLWLDHPEKRQSASAGWASYLRAGNWSALLLDKKNFLLSCAEIKPGQVDYHDCSKSIKVCLSNIKASKQGTYWLVEDKSYDELLKDLKKRGFSV